MALYFFTRAEDNAPRGRDLSAAASADCRGGNAVPLQVSLPDEHKTCIYRLVQEAVNNAVRHARARAVEVAVGKEHRNITVSIRDDGAGFDSRFVRGLGILGMEERVRRLGERLNIRSEPGQGTIVQASIPVAELDQKNGNKPDSDSDR